MTELTESEEKYNCSYVSLKSLKERKIPDKINGDFNCSGNYLTSLEGCPKYVKYNYYCQNNNLTSLEGSPEFINGNFECSGNQLENLKGRPKFVKDIFYCRNNKKLKNVKHQIIENQIEGKYYSTDEGNFYFKEIEEDFKSYGEYLIKKELKLIEKEKQLKEKKLIKKNKLKFSNDFGLGI